MKVLRVFWVLGLCLLAVLDVGALAGRIVVIVNKDAITASDVEERIRLINLSTGRPVTTPVPNELRKQVVQGMIEEILQLQVAREKKVKITDSEGEKALEGLAKENNMKP